MLVFYFIHRNKNLSKKNETGIVYIRTFAQIRDRTNGVERCLKIFLAEDEVVVREDDQTNDPVGGTWL